MNKLLTFINQLKNKLKTIKKQKTFQFTVYSKYDFQDSYLSIAKISKASTIYDFIRNYFWLFKEENCVGVIVEKKETGNEITLLTDRLNPNSVVDTLYKYAPDGYIIFIKNKTVIF